jgi:threonine/homoserine/homoserine lactone efflux protein
MSWGTSLGQGAILGLSAAAAPGPFQALLVARSIQTGPVRALPLALVPFASDGPAMATVLLLLSRLPPGFVTALRVAGIAVMLAIAVATLRAASRAAADREPDRDAPRGFLQAGLVNLTNPNLWIFWSVIGGPVLAEAWRGSPAAGIAFVAAFYACITAGNAALLALAGGLARAGTWARRTLGIASGAALLGFAAWQAVLLVRG